MLTLDQALSRDVILHSTAMKIVRKSFRVNYQANFPRPASGLVTQTPKLLEGILESLGDQFPPRARDVKIRSGASLDDWLIQIYLFNYLGKIELTAEGIRCSFERLVTDSDLSVVTQVLECLTTALAAHSPTQGYSSEAVSGSVTYEVLDGAESRSAYLGEISFRGKSSAHFDVGIKTRLKHSSQPVIGMFEVSPNWANKNELFFWFDVETTSLKEMDLPKRAQVANELVLQALDSFGLEVIEAVKQ